MRLLKILAIVLGSIWFFPVSCTTGAMIGTPIVAALDERHVQKGDMVHTLFKVVAEPGEQGMPFRVLGMDQIKSYLASSTAEAAKAPVTFRMSVPSGSIHSGGSKFKYRVLEDAGEQQLIELVETYDDGDNTIWSRYRATKATVSPVSSRMFYFGYMFSATFYAFVGAWVLYGVGRLLRRRLAVPKAATKNS